MPTLMLRALPADLVGRVRGYAAAQGLGVTDAAARLLTIALDHLESRQRGAAVANSRLTPEQRSARARHAVAAREARRQHQP